MHRCRRALGWPALGHRFVCVCVCRSRERTRSASGAKYDKFSREGFSASVSVVCLAERRVTRSERHEMDDGRVSIARTDTDTFCPRVTPETGPRPVSSPYGFPSRPRHAACPRTATPRRAAPSRSRVKITDRFTHGPRTKTQQQHAAANPPAPAPGWSTRETTRYSGLCMHAACRVVRPVRIHQRATPLITRRERALRRAPCATGPVAAECLAPWSCGEAPSDESRSDGEARWTRRTDRRHR